MKWPSACWLETRGEIAAGRFCRGLGIPLADARLLAIDEDRSRAVGLPTRDNLGGPCASGEVALLSCCSALSAAVTVAVADASRVAARGSASSGTGFSCLVLMICPSLRCCCSSRFKMRMASESEESCAAAANSAAARSCSSLAATGFDLLVSMDALRA